MSGVNTVQRLRSAAIAFALVTTSVAVASTATNLAGAAAPPNPPGTVTVSAVTSSSAALAWPASTSPRIVGYQVWISRNGAPARQVTTTDSTVRRYNLRTLYANSTYNVSVYALDTDGQRSTASPASFSTPVTTPADSTPPNAPSSSSVSLHVFSDSRIDIVWGGSTSTDVVGYRVFRNGAQVGAVDLPGGLRYSDRPLAASTSYSYTIEAVDSSGNASSPTTAKQATTLGIGAVRIARGPYLSAVTGRAATVSWWTNIPTKGVVHYGVGSPSGTLNDPSSVQHHAVRLTGLTPGATYRYTVGDGTVTSPQAGFHTAANPGTTFSFAAIGDFGGGSPGEAQNAANIAADGTSFIQTVGDNIYPSSGAPDPDFSTQYSDFDARLFKQFGPALAAQPFFPANGNQEYYSGGKFWQTFPMPGTNHSWYSYDWGDAHILVLDSEQATDPSSAQYAFAQNDLAGHQTARFRIVAIQAPPYSSTSATSSSKPILQNLVPLFERQHVALVLSGNSHNYERSVPLLNGSRAANGVTYIVTGGGGNGHNSFVTNPAPSWSASRDGTRYEFVKVTVSPTALRVSAIDAATNTVFDSTSISAGALPGVVVPTKAHRVLDTASGVGAARKPVAAHKSVAVPVTGGNTGVPTNAAAVLLSVRSAQVSRTGAVAVYPHGGKLPPGGNVAAIPARTSIATVLVPVGSDGKVTLTNTTAGSMNLGADIVGYVRGGASAGVPGAVVPSTPHAVLNTSTGLGTTRAPVAAHSTIRVTVRGGSTGVPSNAVSALVTVRAWQVRKAGAVAAFPDGGSARGQNLAAIPGSPTVTQLLLPVGRSGKIALTNATGSTVQLAAVVSGFVRSGSSTGVSGAMVPMGAHQVLGTAGGIGAPRRPLAAHSSLHVVVTGAGVPKTARAVVLNLTSLHVARSGGVWAYADGAARAADASFAAIARARTFGQLVVPIGAGGKITLTNGTAGAMDLAGYVAGYVRGS